MKLIFPLLFTILFFNCNSPTHKKNPEDKPGADTSQLFENSNPYLSPMYGNLKKTPEEITLDKKIIDDELKLSGDTFTAEKNMAGNGWNYFYYKVMDTAMLRFNQCWLIDSTYPESYFGFAAILEYQGLNDEAEKYYRLAYYYDPTDAISMECLHKIASIKEQQGDTLGLIQAFKRVYSKFPNDSIATGKLGYFYDIINKSDSALKYYNLTIAIDPYYFQTYINRGLHYFQNNQIDKAISDFTSAIQRNKNSVAAYINRANAYMYSKQFENAVPDIKYCISLVPDEPLFHKLLADCYFQLNKNDQACEELHIAIKKGGQYADILKKYNCK